MSIYEDLCKASARGKARREAATKTAEENYRNCQKLVLDFVTGFCNALAWPLDKTAYIDLKDGQQRQGPLTEAAPILLYDSDPITRKFTDYSTGIELTLIEEGSGAKKQLLIRFDFFPTDEGTAVVFNETAYLLPKDKQEVYNVVCSAIKDKLESGADVFPHRLNWPKD
jgi:hypothetical protein